MCPTAHTDCSSTELALRPCKTQRAKVEWLINVSDTLAG